MTSKYTREVLLEHTIHATSFRDLARRFGLAPTGSNTINLARRCKQHNINTSHFLGQGHNKGKRSKKRLEHTDILVLSSPEKGRIRPAYLKRALIECGHEYKCDVCSNDGRWMNQPLSLQVDHLNGKFWDNRKRNLRFLCPNCHTQTDNWGNRKR